MSLYSEFWLVGQLLLCTGTAWRAPSRGVPVGRAVGLLLLSLPFAWLGARLHTYLLEEELPLLHLFLAPSNLMRPGFRLAGALVAGVLAARVFAWIFRTPFAEWADIVSPLVPAAVSLGRIGCYLTGCCFGHVSNLPWAATYPFPSPAFANHDARQLLEAGQLVSLPVHPLQLYLAISGITVTIVVCLWEHRRSFAGQVTLVTLGLHLGSVGILEYFRETAMMPPVPLRAVAPVVVSIAAWVWLAIATTAARRAARQLAQ